MGEPDKDAEGKPKAQPPKLPDNAPAALKQFLECKGNRLTFKPGKLPFVKGKPSITFEAGEKAGEVKVSVGWGILSLTIPATVKDGQLSVDTSTAQKVFKAASEFSDDLKDFDPKAIDDWVKELNDWLKANNRKLGPLELKDGKLTIAKVAVAAPPQKAMAPGAPAGKGAPAQATPGLKGKVAVGGAAMLLGFGLGGGAGGLWGGGDVQVNPFTGTPVPVTAAQAPEAEPEVETRTVVSLPDGPVDASLTFTVVSTGQTFDNPATFEQAGRDLTLTVAGVDSFLGTIDESGAFSVSNSVGSFDGTIRGDQVEADHTFQGEDFTIQGTLAQPAVEEQVTEEGSDGQSQPVLAGVVGGDVQVAPEADGEQDGANVPVAAAGGLLAAVGAGLLVTQRNGETRTCDAEQAALDAAVAEYAREDQDRADLERRLAQANQEASRRRELLDSVLPRGVELERAGTSPELRIDESTLPLGGLAERLASPPESQDEVKQRLDRYNEALVDVWTLEQHLSTTKARVAEARENIEETESALAGCERRAPRPFSELEPMPGLTDNVM